MGERPAESDALRTWFAKQRRDWWRVNWWGLVLILVLWMLTPFGIAAAMALFKPVGQMLYRGGAAHWFQYLPWINLLILVTSAWMVARLGATYNIPDDLLLATSPRECNRAFAAVLRKDVYLVIAGFAFLPYLVLGYLQAGAMDPGGIFIFALTLGGAAALLSELSIYLRLVKRRAHLMFHTFAPLVIATAGYSLIALLLIVLAKQTHLGDLTDSVNMMLVIPLLSLAALVVAWILYRRSYSPRIAAQTWVHHS